MRNMGTTTLWKQKNSQQSINICIHKTLLHELDSLKIITQTNQSEIIRTAIRKHIKEMKNELIQAERDELQLYQSHRRDERQRGDTDSELEFWVKA